ncbi:MAG: L-2-amino-thiazoline-4-carboxylic acid hydrolase, partial [Candidatus Aminicenantes bacterium]
MTWKDVYSFAFQGHLIPILQSLANVIGEEKFIEILKKASSEAGAQNMKNRTKNMPEKDLAALASFIKANPVFKRVLTYEIVEESDKAFEIKVIECLWAKTFREANASEVGYASICHPDFASTRAFNPKIELIRT